MTWLLMALTFSSWLLWGLVSRDLFVVATDVLALPGAIWALWRIYRDGGLTVRRSVSAGGAAVAALAVQFLSGPLGSLLAVVALTASTRTVQLLKIRVSGDISGVSAHPWAVSTLSQVCWLGYGVTTADLVVAAHAPFAVAANLALLLVLHRRRRALAGRT